MHWIGSLFVVKGFFRKLEESNYLSPHHHGIFSKNYKVSTYPYTLWAVNPKGKNKLLSALIYQHPPCKSLSKGGVVFQN
jgi:hypothetical protein